MDQSNVDSIVLFGSRAKGTFKPGSDIDICIDGDSIQYDDLLRFQLKYDELFLPWKLDLVAKKMVKEPALLDHIKLVGISLK